jgi:hypothetical protein
MTSWRSVSWDDGLEKHHLKCRVKCRAVSACRALIVPHFAEWRGDLVADVPKYRRTR